MRRSLGRPLGRPLGGLSISAGHGDSFVARSSVRKRSVASDLLPVRRDCRADMTAIDMSRTDIHVGFALSKLSRSVSFCQNLSRRAHLIAKGQKETGPCFSSGPGDRPHSSFFISLKSRGMAHRQSAGLDRQAEGLVRFPGLGVKHHAQRPAVRQRGIFGLRLSQRSGRARSCLSLAGFSRGRPWVGLRERAPASLPLPFPALTRPRENALDDGSDSDICRLKKFHCQEQFH